MHVKISVNSQQIQRRYLLVLFKAQIIFNDTYLLSRDSEVALPYLFDACTEV